ncbi:Glycoprotein elicitor [Phytophthora megakarya]|uniref:Glycoprotein elicitor n=1 Tax=Phytophthora megakarya TaxID=4795 RepID=A0A225V2U3_9STRA|nr:Glycoprotein elicitor [Phytophthora megakarya]
MKSPQYLSSVVLAAVVAFVTLPHSTATPFAYNPFMVNECAISQLSHKSPAFGAVEPDLDEVYSTYVEFAYPVLTDNKPVNRKLITLRNKFTNKLDATSSQTNADIERLENFFGTTLEMNAKNLAANAAYYVMPWPSSYWAVYQDGINHRRNSDESSASEKYATAFGLNATEFMGKISETSGVLSMKSRKQCTTVVDCMNLNDESKCAIREGEQVGYCIPSWFGICHAWSPAALLEPEPRCVVEKNGVTFHPMDIKALLTQVYDDGQVETVFTGARFDKADSTATKDQFGRYIDGSRRDLGPGYMHVALTNIIGRFNSSVVLDVAGGAEVWNQPVYNYEVVAQTELSLTEAANQFYNQNTYPFNSEAKRIMYTEMKVSWMVETFEDGGLVVSGRASEYMNSKVYTYLLELDDSYNILGGEWVGQSNDDHPDFLWLPKARPSMDTITNVGISYKNVRELLDEATNCA